MLIGPRGTAPSSAARAIVAGVGAAVLALMIAGCSEPHAAAPPSGKTVAIAPHLEPGCPLGSEALLGLNLEENSCRESYRLTPPGAVGSPPNN